MYSRGGSGCGGLRGWGRRGVMEEREGVGARCTGSLWGSDSDVALLLPSPEKI